MPTYTYTCKNCDHHFELFHPMSDNSQKYCPVCEGEAVRMMGTGVGLVFKGSGFYLTDYKNGKNGSFSKTNGSAKSNGTSSSKSSSSCSCSGGDCSKC